MNIPLNIDILQVLLHMLNFVILFGGLTLLLFVPVCKFLDERKAYYEELEGKIAKGAESNAAIRIEYEEKMKATDLEIAEKKKNCEKEISELTTKCLKEAREKANAIVLAAEREGEARKEHILESAQTEIGELVLSTTQKLLGSGVTPEQNRALYDEFLRVTAKDRTGEEEQND